MVCLDQIDTKAGKLEDCCIQGDAVIGIEKKKKKTQGPSKKKADICTERQEHNQKRLTHNLEIFRIVKLLELFLIYTWF